MKKVLLIAMSLFFAAPDMQAQEKNKDEEVKTVLVKEDNSDNYYYEGVVPVEGVSKEEMYKKGKKWILENLKTTDNNIVFDDANLSIITSSNVILKPLHTYFSEAVMTFKVSFEVKDNRYRFRVDHLVAYMKKDLLYSVEEIPYSKMKTDARRSYRKINANLSNQMNSKTEEITEQLKLAIQHNKSNW